MHRSKKRRRVQERVHRETQAEGDKTSQAFRRKLQPDALTATGTPIYRDETQVVRRGHRGDAFQGAAFARRQCTHR